MEEPILVNKKPKILLAITIAMLLILAGIIYFIYARSPQLIINKSISATSQVKSLHFEQIVSETATNGVISKGTGDIIFPDKLRINIAPESKDVETDIIGDRVYTKWQNKWALIQGKNINEFNIINPQKFIALLGFVSNVKSLGTEKIDNQDMNHLGFAIDKNEAQKTFAQSANISYNGEVWIGKDDGLIHRIAITFTSDKSGEAPVKYQMDFSGFNSGIIIEEPKI